MGRRQKNNVDYFPFICKEGETTKYVENTYGNDGFATWVKILRALAITDFHFLDLSNRKKLMTLCSTCKVSEDFLMKFLSDLAEFKEIDSELWVKKIVWSDQFIESIEDAYAKRTNDIIKREELIHMLKGFRTRKSRKRRSKGPGNTQSILDNTIVKNNKVKDIKEEETKEEETKLITADVWPSFLDFWNKYDKDVGKTKAEKIWQTIQQDAREKIMQHLDHYALKDKQYRKDPERYLKNETWNDEVIITPPHNVTDKRQQQNNDLKSNFAKKIVSGNNSK